MIEVRYGGFLLCVVRVGAVVLGSIVTVGGQCYKITSLQGNQAYTVRRADLDSALKPRSFLGAEVPV